MQFTLQTLLLSFVVVASALAAFEWWGLAVAAVILAVVAAIRGSRSLKSAVVNTILVLTVGLGPVVALLLPAVQSLHESGRRGWCANNMKCIAVALHAYHDEQGHFPPAYLLGPDGKPWHSWRTLILPYLEYGALYEQYRFDEPWDGPNNRRLASSSVLDFTCPSSASSAQGRTDYVAVVGPKTMWPGQAPVSLDDVKDGSESTILLVEIDRSDINWAEPRDVSFAELCEGVYQGHAIWIFSHHWNGSYYQHPGEFTNVALADGSIHGLNMSTSPDAWRALLTRDGGEQIDGDWDYSIRRLHWGHIGGLVCLALSAALLLLRPIRRRDETTTADRRPNDQYPNDQ